MERIGEFRHIRQGSGAAGYVLYVCRVVAAGFLVVKSLFGLLPPEGLNQHHPFYFCADRSLPMLSANAALLAVAATLCLGFYSRLSAALSMLLIVVIFWHCGPLLTQQSANYFVVILLLLAAVSSHGGGRFALDKMPNPHRFAGWR